LLTNDSYIMGSHLNHMIFTLPIFHGGEIVAFSSSMAHWQDVGGVLGTTTQDIFSEGLQMPIVKIFKRGKQDRELTEIIRTNVRLPELAMGDFRAQIAAIKTGEIRYRALLEKYGRAAVDASIISIFEQSERLARQSVAAIPDGTYEAESFMDDDGISSANIPLKVRVIVAGDHMTIDLSDVSRQVRGYFNSGATAGRSAAQVAFKCLTTPTLYPINEGSFRPLTIVLPPGRVVSATKPAATRWWMTIPMTVVDTIFKALAPAVPDRVAAGHYADLCTADVFGVDQRSGRFFYRPACLPGGGWGAKHNGDGMSATICLNDGDTHNFIAEAMEAKIPVLIEKNALRPDSGGAGRYRGGLGVEFRFRARAPMQFNAHIERTQCAPWGLDAGKPGLANRVTLERADGSVQRGPNGKRNAVPLAVDDVVIVESGGGGGYGDPLARPRDEVRKDVQRGYVTPQAAIDDYGLPPKELEHAR
jgi:N-methylhydantoinase B